MMNIKNIVLPDIGDFYEVKIIEILVNVGDKINTNDSIVTLEKDKSSMKIPSPYTGIITKIEVNIGNKIKQNDIILSIESEYSEIQNTNKNIKNEYQKTEIIPVVVPNIGDFDEIEVIEILVSVGDELSVEDSIITLESDKASMEIPTPVAGKVININVALGDKISLGTLILNIKSIAEETPTEIKIQSSTPIPIPPNPSTLTPITNNINQIVSEPIRGNSHASPSIRKLARELGVNLSYITGTGRKGRILDTDLKSHVKQIITSNNFNSVLPKPPIIDFSKFGNTETIKLSRINKLSGKHLTTCWLSIPHVTQFDEVNINQMEAYRQEQKANGIKLTPLVFIMKALVRTLKNHLRFNASLDESGENLIIKKYFNLGIAMDTPKGLIVPVIRDVEKKSLTDLAKELFETSKNARENKLKPADMQGSGLTISSLGGIGGTQFTPIVNAPEVAILGISRSYFKPTWDGENFIPTLTLPLALSYDHRVIDGAQGGRFMAELNTTLREANYD
ncbi:pyruvate dehydrogenase complex E2 component [Candidatus Vesicomyidisocius calyptogenae]|uniref:Dihydrolipoamide acetyltransferase component of pyruvate dehydrogenase complex n=2 Tax=Vesicomyosocius okutanii subsp. Calyptogena okutanii (strain HA) TaxID=412965 RepID=A5CVP1_VESOH|nr:pyruvate dehydrogenase complex E2 component [Candidatus Vesicomyosocius okutanii]